MLICWKMMIKTGFRFLLEGLAGFPLFQCQSDTSFRRIQSGWWLMMSFHLKTFWKLFQIITEHYKALVASPQTDHYFAWCSVLFVPTIVICHWEATRRRAKKNQDKIYGAAGRRSVLTMLLRKSDTNINIKLWLNICILSWLEIYILSLSYLTIRWQMCTFCDQKVLI